MVDYLKQIKNLNTKIDNLNNSTTYDYNTSKSSDNSSFFDTWSKKIFTKEYKYYIFLPIIILLILVLSKPVFVLKKRDVGTNVTNFKMLMSEDYDTSDKPQLCYESLAKWTIILSLVGYSGIYYCSKDKTCSTTCSL